MSFIQMRHFLNLFGDRRLIPEVEAQVGYGVSLVHSGVQYCPQSPPGPLFPRLIPDDIPDDTKLDQPVTVAKHPMWPAAFDDNFYVHFSWVIYMLA